MNVYWWLCAGALILGFPLVDRIGSHFIKRLTGRESPPKRQSFAYDAIYFGLALAIGLPPIYFLPDADPLVIAAFLFLGATVGSLTGQAILGRRNS